MDAMELKRKGNANGTGGTPVIRTDGELAYLVFPSLCQTGFVSHLFTTRRGGVSRGIYSSMNLSYTRGDEKDAVDENFRRIAKVLHRSPQDFVCSDQTHTVRVRRVTEKDRGKGVTREKDYTEVDGLITDVPGLVLATFYADCVPLFFVDPVHRAVGLSHSGWRGTVGNMAAHTLRAMKKAYGTEPSQVVAAIGPSICQDCYEVSGDVAEAFAQAFPANTLPLLLYRKRQIPGKADGKYQLNLWEANRLRLLTAGVLKERISVTDICTCCNPSVLFSHRASHGKRGNLGAFLSINRADD